MNEKNPVTRSENDAALFEHLIEGIKDYAIFMINLEGRMATWNPGVKRLLGYDENEFIGKDFSMIFSDEDIMLNIPSSELNTAKATGRAEDERWHKRKDGSSFWANGLVTLMKDDGKIVGFAKIMRDQTQKKQFEEQLTAQANALATANKELSNFAGILSHDLNEPLQTVYGFANILKRQEGLDRDAEESVHYIIAGTERMIKLVTELLQYTVAENNDENISFIDTAIVVQDVLLALNSTISIQGATISTDGLPTIHTNSTQLGRVFQNLIENAIKYSAKDRTPEIRITATDNGVETVFSVEDNGRGIAASEMTKLFTLFERLHPESTIPGQGIGLATCKKIVERIGGKMWVTSKLNIGSTFFFTIPHPIESEDEVKAEIGPAQPLSAASLTESSLTHGSSAEGTRVH